jgi:hypothetical protein
MNTLEATALLTAPLRAAAAGAGAEPSQSPIAEEKGGLAELNSP